MTFSNSEIKLLEDMVSDNLQEAIDRMEAVKSSNWLGTQPLYYTHKSYANKLATILQKIKKEKNNGTLR